MVHRNSYRKIICEVEGITNEGLVDSFETFGFELPFTCKRCSKPIIDCSYAGTMEDEHKNNEWLQQPFIRPPLETRLQDYLGVRSVITCISPECCGSNSRPLLEFHIENLISIADQIQTLSD